MGRRTASCLAFEEYEQAHDRGMGEMAGKLSSTAGVNCVDATNAQGYLVAHEGASALLHNVMAEI